MLNILQELGIDSAYGKPIEQVNFPGLLYLLIGSTNKDTPRGLRLILDTHALLEAVFSQNVPNFMDEDEHSSLDKVRREVRSFKIGLEIGMSLQKEARKQE